MQSFVASAVMYISPQFAAHGPAGLDPGVAEEAAEEAAADAVP